VDSVVNTGENGTPSETSQLYPGYKVDANGGVFVDDVKLSTAISRIMDNDFTVAVLLCNALAFLSDKKGVVLPCQGAQEDVVISQLPRIIGAFVRICDMWVLEGGFEGENAPTIRFEVIPKVSTDPFSVVNWWELHDPAAYACRAYTTTRNGDSKKFVATILTCTRKSDDKDEIDELSRKCPSCTTLPLPVQSVNLGGSFSTDKSSGGEKVVKTPKARLQLVSTFGYDKSLVDESNTDIIKGESYWLGPLFHMATFMYQKRLGRASGVSPSVLKGDPGSCFARFDENGSCRMGCTANAYKELKASMQGKKLSTFSYPKNPRRLPDYAKMYISAFTTYIKSIFSERLGVKNVPKDDPCLKKFLGDDEDESNKILLIKWKNEDGENKEVFSKDVREDLTKVRNALNAMRKIKEELQKRFPSALKSYHEDMQEMVKEKGKGVDEVTTIVREDILKAAKEMIANFPGNEYTASFTVFFHVHDEVAARVCNRTLLPPGVLRIPEKTPKENRVSALYADNPEAQWLKMMVHNSCSRSFFPVRLLSEDDTRLPEDVVRPRLVDSVKTGASARTYSHDPLCEAQQRQLETAMFSASVGHIVSRKADPVATKSQQCRNYTYIKKGDIAIVFTSTLAYDTGKGGIYYRAGIVPQGLSILKRHSDADVVDTGSEDQQPSTEETSDDNDVEDLWDNIHQEAMNQAMAIDAKASIDDGRSDPSTMRYNISGQLGLLATGELERIWGKLFATNDKVRELFPVVTGKRPRNDGEESQKKKKLQNTDQVQGRAVDSNDVTTTGSSSHEPDSGGEEDEEEGEEEEDYPGYAEDSQMPDA